MKALFEISKSGLRTAERSLAVTAHNIVNADTAGYSRQRVDKFAMDQKLTGFRTGLGVHMSGTTRLRDDLTDVQMHDKRNSLGFMSQQSRIYEQLEASLASETGGDLDARINKLFNMFSELASDPQDNSVRNNLVVEARQLTEKFHELSRNVTRTSELTRDSGVGSIAEINELLRDLASLNDSISKAHASGQPDHQSQDTQVRKLAQLSELVDFDLMKTDNGSMELRIGGVQVLADNRAATLSGDIDDTSRTFALRLENGKLVKPTGGKLAADMQMYQKGIPDLMQRLDSLAGTIAKEFNAIHTQGYGLNDATNRVFFDPEGLTAATIKLNPDIENNHRNVAASSVPGEAGNGEISRRLSDLRNEKLLDGRKMVEFTVEIIALPGTKVSEFRSAIETRETELRMLEVQQQRTSGVSIDEEMSMLIQFQNAYQGAARVMSAGQTMYDTLLSILR
jgi:flagellar hook-associated protein 1